MCDADELKRKDITIQELADACDEANNQLDRYDLVVEALLDKIQKLERELDKYRC